MKILNKTNFNSTLDKVTASYLMNIEGGNCY